MKMFSKPINLPIPSKLGAFYKHLVEMLSVIHNCIYVNITGHNWPKLVIERWHIR